MAKREERKAEQTDENSSAWHAETDRLRILPILGARPPARLMGLMGLMEVPAGGRSLEVVQGAITLVFADGLLGGLRLDWHVVGGRRGPMPSRQAVWANGRCCRSGWRSDDGVWCKFVVVLVLGMARNTKREKIVRVSVMWL
jgi:hypothetical protein